MVSSASCPPEDSRAPSRVVLLVLLLGLAAGTPSVHAVMMQRRLHEAVTTVGATLAEARRHAFQMKVPVRVEVAPGQGRVSVFARHAPDGEVEVRRQYLPSGIRFVEPRAVTSFQFDSRGRLEVHPVQLRMRAVRSSRVRTISVRAAGGTTTS